METRHPVQHTSKETSAMSTSSTGAVAKARTDIQAESGASAILTFLRHWGTILVIILFGVFSR